MDEMDPKPEEESPKTFDPCPRCDGHYTVYDSRQRFTTSIRVAYICCNKCKFKPKNNRLEFPMIHRPRRRTNGTEDGGSGEPVY